MLNTLIVIKQYLLMLMIISYLKTIIKEGKFDSELVYGDNDNYIKRKIMIYEDKVNSHFQDKKLSKENVSYK